MPIHYLFFFPFGVWLFCIFLTLLVLLNLIQLRYRLSIHILFILLQALLVLKILLILLIFLLGSFCLFFIVFGWFWLCVVRLRPFFLGCLWVWLVRRFIILRDFFDRPFDIFLRLFFYSFCIFFRFYLFWYLRFFYSTFGSSFLGSTFFGGIYNKSYKKCMNRSFLRSEWDCKGNKSSVFTIFDGEDNDGD